MSPSDANDSLRYELKLMENVSKANHKIDELDVDQDHLDDDNGMTQSI